MVHHLHDSGLVPPHGVAHALDVAAHDDDLAGGHQTAAAVGRAQMRRHAGGRDVAVQGGLQTGDELGALARRPLLRRVGGEDEVAVEVDDQGVGGRGEERAALGGEAEDVGPGFLDEVARVAGVHDGHVQAGPLVGAHEEADGFGGDGEHGGVVGDEDDAAGGGTGGLEDADEVGQGEAVEEGPEGEVLELRGGRGELVAERVVFHVDAHEVVETRGGEGEDAGDFFGVEEIGRFVPVDPHAAEVVAQEVVEGVATEEAETVGNPIRRVHVDVIRLGATAEVADRVGALVVGT